MELKNNKGFTGVEVAISTIIIIVFVSFIAAMFTNISVSSKKIERKTKATEIAINVIEALKATDFDSLEEIGTKTTTESGEETIECDVVTQDEFTTITSQNVTFDTGYTVKIYVEDYYGQGVIKIIKVQVSYLASKNNPDTVEILTLIKKDTETTTGNSGDAQVDNLTYSKSGTGYKINLENITYEGNYSVEYKKEGDTEYTIVGTNLTNSSYSFDVASYGLYRINVKDKSTNKKSRKGITVSIYDGVTFNQGEKIKVVDTITDTSITTTTAWIPEKFTISGATGEYPGTLLGVSSANERLDTINDGMVVYLLNGNSVTWTDSSAVTTAKETYDQFVWVPVPNPVATDKDSNGTIDATDLDLMIEDEQYPMAIERSGTDSNGLQNYRGVLYDFTLTDGKVVASDLSWSSTSTSWREPAYLIDSAYADESSYNTVGITKDSLQEEFNAMVNRVKNNKGFWTGRYETSNMAGTASTSNSDSLNKTTVVADSTNRVTVIKGTMTGISYDSSIPNYINWYRMYAQQKNYSKLALGSTTTTTSSMIWGSQWDQIMIWMKDVDNTSQSSKYVVNAIGMGNFNVSGVDDGYSDTSDPAATGCFDVKNIYDLAGNVLDWTLEAYNTYHRVGRRKQLHC